MPINLGNGLVTGNILLRTGAGGGGGGGASVNVPAHSILFSSSGTDICGNSNLTYNGTIKMNNVDYKTIKDASDNIGLFIGTTSTTKPDIVVGNSVHIIDLGNSQGNNVIIGNNNFDNYGGGIQNVLLFGYDNINNEANSYNKLLIYGSHNKTLQNDMIIGYDNESDGNNMTIGSNNLAYYTNNIILGDSNQTYGNNNIIIGKNNICGTNSNILGSNNSNSDIASYTNCSIIGNGTTVTANDQIQLGGSGTTVYAYGAVQDRSDVRDKADIVEIPVGLDFLNKLKPKFYRWNYREDYFQRDASNNLIVDSSKNPIMNTQDYSKKRLRYHAGLIAQDVKQTMDEISIDFGLYQDHLVNGGKDVKSLGYTELIPVLIKAVQELSAKNVELENRIKILENK
jgi:hypothetical protein